MDNTWKLVDYTIIELQNAIENKKITIPPYQRGIVWDPNKKRSLIETIKKGYPFGSILIYEDENGKQQLIDGLQRCSTIFDYVNNPSNYFEEIDIDNNEVYKIIDLAGFGNSDAQSTKAKLTEKIRSIIVNWIKSSHKSIAEIKSIQYYDLARMIAKELPTLNDYNKVDEMINILKPMLQEFIQSLDFIVDVKIPAIKLYGSQENLPEIFEKINSSGSNLTKYQIYNATWSGVNIKIVNPNLVDIIDHVCNRYDEMVDGLIDIEDYDSTKMKKDKKLNVFDLCFGFGKKLCEQFPYLFGKSENKIKIESVGFSLINACMGYKVSELDKLHIHIKNLGNDEFINTFLLKIIESVRETDKILRIVTTFKGNKKDNKNITINHTEMQIVSIIAFIFIQKYVTFERDIDENIINRTIDFSNLSASWRENKALFFDNCIKIYIMDVLGEKWRGSGDKKLNTIILNSNYYFRNILWPEFEMALDTWYNSILVERKEERKVANPKEADKILLNLIYAQEFKAAEHLNDEKFEIEHLATKAAMKSQLELVNKGKKDNEKLKLPISSIGNLCYLPFDDNRTKGKKTIYQDTAYLKNRNLEDIETKYTFTTHDDLEWIEVLNWNSEDLEKMYFEFINTRWEKLKEKIKNGLIWDVK